MSSSSTNTIGKYQIVREIARSNDIVYEAIDPSINRRLAVKELSIPPNVTGAQRRERIERFWREGKAAARLTHPNIVTIFEVDKDGDRHFIAMEYLEGQTLRDVLQAGGPLSLPDAKNYMLQLCSALSCAHSKGVIHRDIKPENVQITPGGHVKLTDFGIARLMGEPSITQNGQVFGTPSYMSPEQVAGKELDARSDIFSLGVLFYEMVAGHKPFQGDSVVTITYNIMNMEPAPPPGAPPWVVSVIRKAMAKDVAMRYATVDEMADDIRDEKPGDVFGMPANGYGTQPGPFGGGQQSASSSQYPPPPQGPLTPYGTPMPSPDPGWHGSSAPDPFSQSAPSIPGPAPAPMPPPAPPKPVLSAETRNFLGILFLTIGVAGMLVFAIWAVKLAYNSFQTAQTSGSAQRYYEQGEKLYRSGQLDGAVAQWRNAVRVSPNSQIAKQAQERIFAVSVESARKSLEQRNFAVLESQANALIKEQPSRPEGHYYLAAAKHLQGDLETAKREYKLASDYGGADQYGQAARRYLGMLYILEGDNYRARGDMARALAAYQNARDYGDSDTLSTAQERINGIGDY